MSLFSGAVFEFNQTKITVDEGLGFDARLIFYVFKYGDIDQAPVVQRLDSAIHRINPYPVDSAISFPNTYPLDSDLSGG